MDKKSVVELAITDVDILDSVYELVKNDINLKEKIQKEPFLFFFTSKFSTNIGDYLRKKFFPLLNIDYNDKKIEAKATRVVGRKKDREENLILRARNSKQGVKGTDTGLRQVTPSNFKEIYAFIIYSDIIEVIKMKSNEISFVSGIKEDGKIDLTKQHSLQKVEGQIVITDELIKKYKIGEIKLLNGIYTYIPS